MIKSQGSMLMVAAGVVVTAAAVASTVNLVNSGSPSTPTSTGQASTSNNGNGNGNGNNGNGNANKSLTVGRIDVTGLAPGKAIVKQMAIGNPNNQDVDLQSVQTVISGPSPSPTSGTCATPTDFEVIVAGYNASTGVGTPVTIAKNSSLNVPVTVRMNNSPTRNQDACKARSWTLTFTATATSK